MSAALNVYGSQVEVFPDGSRELTREERIAQICDEISAEQCERAAHAFRILVRDRDVQAGDANAATSIASLRRYIAGCDERIESLRYELANLQPNAPRESTGD